MRRREFMGLLGGAAVASAFSPRSTGAQQSGVPIIGFVNGSTATAYVAYVQGFLRGLAETGHVVGQNVAVEYRWAEGHYDRIPQMVDELVHRPVAVLAPNTPAARAVKRASGNTPVVFFTGEDPVAAGLVTSLNHPGGNATGVTSMFGGLAAKQVGLLRELAPAAPLFAFLVNPRNPITEPNVKDALDAAKKLSQQLEIVHASSEREIDEAFATTLRQMRPAALLVQPDAFLINKRIVALAARDALPAMYQVRDLVAVGGLMSYGPNNVDMYRQMGTYVGKVLKGANPADMPVLQPTKFELAINLTTAKVLGLKLSDNVLSLADEVIE
jgi:putative ABC transport system substrate-binding protein